MGMFDDLIPSAPQPAGGMFDDLIPAADPLREAKIVGSGLAKGGLSTAGLPGDIANLIGSAMQNHVTGPLFRTMDRAMGRQSPEMVPPNNPLSSSNLLSYGKQAGVVDVPGLEPKTRVERYLKAGSEGVGEALPLGVPGGLPMMLRAGIQGLGGGLSGEGAAEAFPSHPELARAGGNIVGGLAGNTAVNVGSRAANALTGNDGEVLNAYRLAEVNPRLAGDVTGSRGMQWMQATGAKLPGGGAIERGLEDTVKEFGESVNKRASMLGTSSTPQQAGEAIQKAGEDWLRSWQAKSKQAWDALRLQVPSNTPVRVDAYRNILDDVSSTMKDAPETALILQSAFPKALKGAVGVDLGRNRTELSWETVQTIRSRIGERLANPALVSDATTADLKRIYAALTEDMRVAVNLRGPKAEAAFNRANDITRSGHEFIDQQLSKLVGEKIAPEQAYNYLLGQSGSGGTRIAQVGAQMPSAVDEAAAAKLLSMVEPRPGQAGMQAMYSPERFRTEWQKLSTEAQQALFANPQIRERVEALATVAGTMRDSLRRMNSSNTNPAGAWMSVLSAPAAGAAGYAAGGAPGASAATAAALSPVMAGLGASLATANPAVTRYLATPFASQDLPRISRLAPIGAQLLPPVRGLLGAP